MPNPVKGSLLNIADLRNLGRDFTEKEDTDPEVSPAIAALLENPNIDPSVRSMLRQQEKRRIQEVKLNAQLAKIRREQESPSPIATIGGVPIGLQLGTYFKIENSVSRFLVDVFADPINLVGLGSLTRIGRAGRYLRGLSPASKAESMLGAARLYAVASADDVLEATLVKAAKSGDAGTIQNAIRSLAGREVDEGVLKGLSMAGDDAADLARVLKNERSFLNDMEDAFRLEDQLSSVAAPKGRLTNLRGFLDDLAVGKRSIISFGIPFRRPFSEVTLPRAVSDEGFTAIRDIQGLEAAKLTVNSLSDLRPIASKGALEGLPSGVARSVLAADDAFRGADDFAKSAKVASGFADETIQATRGIQAKVVNELARLAGSDPKEALKALEKATEGSESAGKAIQNVQKALSPDRKEASGSIIKGIKEFLKGSPKGRSFEEIFGTRAGEEAVEQFSRAKLAERIAEDTKLGNSLAARESEGIARDFQSAKKAIEDTADAIQDAIDRRSKAPRKARKVRQLEKALQDKLGFTKLESASVARKIDFKDEAVAQADSILRKHSSASLKKLKPVKLPKGARATESVIDKPGVSNVLEEGVSPSGAAKGVADDLTDATQSVESIDTINKILDNVQNAITETAILKDAGVPLKDLLKSGVPWGRVIQAGLRGIDGAATGLKLALFSAFRGSDELLELAARAREAPEKFAAWRASLSSFQQHVLDKIDDIYAEVGKAGLESQVFGDLMDRYVTHIISFSDRSAVEKSKAFAKQYAKNVGKRKVPRSRFALQRVFGDIDAVEAWAALPENARLGIKIEKDISKILDIYYRSSGTAIVRNRALLAMENTVDGLGRPFMINRRAVLPNRANLEQRRKLESVFAKNRDAYDSIHGSPVFDDYWFLKDAREGIEALFSRDFMADAEKLNNGWGTFLRGINRLNSFGKGALFALNPFFHGVNIFYSSAAFNGFSEAVKIQGKVLDHRDLLKFLNGKAFRATTEAERVAQANEVMQMWSTAMRGYSREGASQFFGRDLLEEFLSTTGYQMARPASDTGFDIFDKAMRVFADKVPFLRHPVDALRHVNEFADRMLWQQMRDGHAMFSWVNKREALIRSARAKGLDPFADQALMFKINNEAGAAVTQAFGGTLERLLIHPNFKKAAQLFFLAPDWTLSNLKAATDMFAQIPGIGKVIAPDALMADSRFRFFMAYNVRAAFYIWTFGNISNFIFNQRFIWENGPDSIDEDLGFRSRIELPWTRSDGKKQFADISKQFSEPWKMFANPGKTIFKKMGPLPRAFSNLIIGVDSFGRPVKGQEDGPMADTVKRIGNATGQFIPIVGQNIRQVLSGRRHPLSAAITTLFGIGVRSESPDTFRDRERIQEIETKLDLLRLSR